MDVQQHFWNKDLCSNPQGHSKKIIQHKSRNETKKQAWTAERDLNYKRPNKTSDLFPEWTEHNNYSA